MILVNYNSTDLDFMLSLQKQSCFISWSSWRNINWTNLWGSNDI